MKLWEIILIVSVFIWTILPLFYRSHENFFYFLFLGLNDFLSYTFYISSLWSSQILTIPFHYLIIVFFYRKDFANKKWLLLGLIPSIYAAFNVTHYAQNITILIFHIIFFFMFLKPFITAYFYSNKIEIFYMVLLFYELINIFKLFAFIKDISSGIEVYYVGTIIQISIGIFLIFYSFRKKVELANS